MYVLLNFRFQNAFVYILSRSLLLIGNLNYSLVLKTIVGINVWHTTLW